MLIITESVSQGDPAATLPAAAPQPDPRSSDSEEVDSVGENCLANPLARHTGKRSFLSSVLGSI